MKVQTTGFLLCALLLSTFGHELLNRHLAHQGKSHLLDRENIDNGDYCWVPCDSGSPTTPDSTSPTTPTTPVTPSDSNNTTKEPSNSSLQISVKSSAEIVVVFNESVGVAVTVDVNNNLAALFNQTDGGAVLINLITKEGVYIPGDLNSGLTWTKSQSFEAFFGGLVSLQKLYEFGLSRGTKFHLDGNISVEISGYIQRAFIALGETSLTVEDAASFFLEYALKLAGYLRGSLRGFSQVFGTGNLVVSRSFRQIVSIFGGLAEFFGRIRGGISVLKTYHIKINFQLIFSSESSVTVLGYLVSTLRGHVDLKALFSAHSDNVFLCVAGFSGNSSDNANGIFKVIGEIVALAQHRSSVEVVVTVLIEYFSSSNRSSNDIEDFRAQLKKLSEFIQQNGLSSQLKGSEKIIQGILSGSYKIGEIDIVAIINILIEENPVPLHLLVRILAIIRPVVSLDISVGFLFYRLIVLLVEGELDIIVALIPEIELNYSGNLLVHIFGGLRIRDLTNIYETVKHLPVIRTFLAEIDAGLGVCSHTTIKAIFESQSFRRYSRLIAQIFVRIVQQIHVGGGASIGLNSPTGTETVSQPSEANDRRLRDHHGNGAAARHHLGAENQHKERHLEHHQRHHEKQETVHGSHQQHERSLGHQQHLNRVHGHEKHHGQARHRSHESAAN